jgi:GTPase
MDIQEQISITKYDLYYESRMTKVESAVESLKDVVKEIKVDIRDIHSDLKWILGIMGSMTIIIVGLMAHGFKWF